MNLRTRTIGVFALLCSALILKAQTPATVDRNVYVITHIDVIPANGGIATAIKIMHDQAIESQQDSGCIRFNVLQQDGRPNHFTIVEIWKDKMAFETHTGNEHTKAFREKIQPILGSPFDERLHLLLP